MREVISLHVGGAGTKVGQAYWKQLREEAGVRLDGSCRDIDSPFLTSCSSAFSEEAPSLISSSSSFSEQKSEEAKEAWFVPRCLYIDTDPGMIQQVRATGEHLAPHQLVSGREDASGVFARGYQSFASEHFEPTMEGIRRLAEDCDGLSAFHVFSSSGGGTGSGSAARVLQFLASNHGKKAKICFTIVPSEERTAPVVEPYNAALFSNNTMECSDIDVLFQNTAVQRICRNKLGIVRPTYEHVNALLASVISSVTLGSRYESCILCLDLSEMMCQLPYPRIKHMLTSFAPLPFDSFLDGNNLAPQMPTVEDITTSAFRSDSCLAQADLEQGKYMKCMMMFRGEAPHITPKLINTAISKARASPAINFVDWAPSGIKVGYSHQPQLVPLVGERRERAAQLKSLCGACTNICTDALSVVEQYATPSFDKLAASGVALLHTSAVRSLFANISSKFERLYSKRAFVHHYLSVGMDLDEFSAAAEDLSNHLLDLHEIALDSEDWEGDEGEGDE